MMCDIDLLIPELAGWNDGSGISVGSWISGAGRFDHAVGYSTIFWPTFVLHDDCVFRGPMDDGTYQQWMEACKGDRRAVEIVVNHEHIADLFVNSEYEPSEKIVVFLGATLKDMWSCKLQKDFPERRFCVDFPCESGMGLLDYVITFFQPRAVITK